MKKLSVLALSTLLCFAVACKKEKKEDKMSEDTTEVTEAPKETMVKKAKATLEAKSESTVSGSVVFKQEGDNVSMTALISGLAEGKHAIHIQPSYLLQCFLN